MESTNTYDVLVVGAGLSGCVIAERFANVYNKKVLIIQSRDHIAGNCYDFIDQNGLLINKYGPHFFHTNDHRVWEYIQKFSHWTRWEHKVASVIDGQFIPVPPNITTVNMLCGVNIQTEQEMSEWLNANTVKYQTITNGQQVAKSRVGQILYQKIFKYYTWKQWNKYPNELSSQVLARIPIRKNFDDRYFTDKYQALPTKGYTAFCENIIRHPNIQVKLSYDYFAHRDTEQFKALLNKDCIFVYTGPIDRYFKNSGLPPLQYRSLYFEYEHIKNINGFYQTHSQVNYPSLDVNFTRITEYKHILNQKSPHTTIAKQYSTDKGDPYYPVPNKQNQQLYEKYRELALKQTNQKGVHFLGRLANYKYFNMDQTIANALTYFDTMQVKKQ